MIKLKINEFIAEVKEEIRCYEELGEEKANEWERDFKKWLSEGKNKKHIKGEGENTCYAISDEGEIFEIADRYLQAVEDNSINNYWKNF